jgi:hypothetical protein
MKKAVTFRLDSDLYAAAREFAQQENRTVTNFVETVLMQHMRRKLTTDGQSDPEPAASAGNRAAASRAEIS